MAHQKLFPSQQPDEKIILIVREHWFRLFVKIFVVALMSLLPWVFQMLLVNSTILDRSETASLIAAAVINIYYLGLLIALFIIFVLYYLNVHIVSEQRVVDIDQASLLSHEVSELNIETIEDVSSHTVGVFGNLLDYGTVYVQTAGGTERFEFHNVPNPAEIASTILDLYEKHGQKEQPKP
jgi:hypothetical protein